MSFCCLCERPIMGVPTLIAYPADEPTLYYCDKCAGVVFGDACVGSMVRIHDKEKYDSILQSSHIVGMIAAGLMAQENANND